MRPSRCTSRLRNVVSFIIFYPFLPSNQKTYSENSDDEISSFTVMLIGLESAIPPVAEQRPTILNLNIKAARLACSEPPYFLLII